LAFEDIINKKVQPKKINWDMTKYEKDGAYCPNCGSQGISVIRDQLLSDHVEKDVRCNSCGMEWREVWNKDIELELEELQIDCTMIS
jgi:formate dehydrogenase maturation protein FdhE